MLERARTADVPAKWVTGDSAYGNDPKLRVWLEEQSQPYVLGIASHRTLWSADDEGLFQLKLSEYVAEQPEHGWVRLSAGDGAKGPRLYDWTRGLLAPAKQVGWEHWWLARRSISDPSDIAYYFTFGPATTSLEKLVEVAGLRWAVEESLESAKGEVGLDQYEVRKWEGWYRHMTLVLLAHAFLTVTRAKAVGSDGEKGGRSSWMWS
jgi:SRSO17 transposase